MYQNEQQDEYWNESNPFFQYQNNQQFRSQVHNQSLHPNTSQDMELTPVYDHTVKPKDEDSSSDLEIIENEFETIDHQISDSNLLVCGTNRHIRCFVLDKIGYKNRPLKLWTVKLPHCSSSCLIHSVVDNGMVYATSSGRLFAIQGSDGTIMWEIQYSQYYGKFLLFTNIKIVDENRLILSGGSRIICVERFNGTVIWERHVNDFWKTKIYEPMASLIHNGIVYFGYCGRVGALLLGDGTELWTRKLTKTFIGGAITLSMVNNGTDNILVIGRKSKLQLVDSMTGEDIYGFDPVSIGSLEMPVAQLIIGDTLYIGCHGSVSAYDPVTMVRKWKNNLSGCGYSYTFSMKEYHGHLLVCMGYVVLMTFDGEIVWKKSASMGSSIILDNASIYVGTMGTIKCYDGKSETIYNDNLKGLSYYHVILSKQGDYSDGNSDTIAAGIFKQIQDSNN
eukprot:TRINITY_DN12255_c0_g1_i1.p1 TRINITY_DN12255_c0_g1~~TRINITY_DN12255_c0_g1_i1.p1  ORF type:complete len:449 (+),score=65.31 TRINITY_DN12255_c0_g1_i1:38-1384(+)